MRLSKVIFKAPVDGIFGESVQALSTGESPTIRSVASLDVTAMGLLITKHSTGELRWVPHDSCMIGEVVVDEPAAVAAPKKVGSK